MKHRILFTLLFLPTFISATEPEPSMSFQGYSGLINTPTATLFDEGKVYTQYSNQVETRNGYRDGSNYSFAVGLWENVEISGRLADYNFGGESGLTDLSANIKLGIPYIPKDWFSLAIGIQDVGGAANFFDAKYAVATKSIFENINISLGMGQSDSTQGRLDGIFAGISWQPYNWAKLSVEYDAADTQVGLHISSPESWLNNGIQLTTNLLLSSTNEELKDDFYYGVGLTIPLNFNSADKFSQPTSTYEKSYTKQEISSLNINDKNPMESSSTVELLRLKKSLVKEGFESVSVGETDLNTVYIEIENHLYNRNQIDGLGVILGILSEEVQHNYSHFTLILKEREVPVLVVKGSLAEYDNFLRDNRPLKLDISTDTYINEEVTSTINTNNNEGFWLKPRFTFWPGIVSRTGTEYGAFDASLALISHVELPLWPGAALTAQHTAQVAETKNFENGEFFSNYKQETGLQEYSFHQTFSLPYSIKNMTFFGKYRDTYNYLANEVRWQNIDGNHKINLFTARYENQITPERKPYPGCNILFLQCFPAQEPQQRDVIIGKYKYYNTRFNTSAELQVGQYWQQDKGAVVKLERMFGDVSINLTYKNTKIDNEESNQFIGIGFSVPLTPRKDYNNKYFQVRGKPQWQYSVNTLVGESHNNLTPGTGDDTQLFYNLDSTFYNNDRLSSLYIYANSNRLKQAYYQAR